MRLEFIQLKNPSIFIFGCSKTTQKLENKILDTHVGSASSLIACQELGFEYVGCELDKRIFNLAKQRLDTYEKQIKLF